MGCVFSKNKYEETRAVRVFSLLWKEEKTKTKTKSWTGMRSPCALKTWPGAGVQTQPSPKPPGSRPARSGLRVSPGSCWSCERCKQLSRVHWGFGPRLEPHGTPPSYAQKVDRPGPCSSLLPLRFSGEGVPLGIVPVAGEVCGCVWKELGCTSWLRRRDSGAGGH